MKRAQLAGGVIGLAAFLFGIPVVDQRSAVGTILDIADFICYGTHASADAALTGTGSNASGTDGIDEGAHEHTAPAGLYMPMFSTPPTGGAVYNGPPLDQC